MGRRMNFPTGIWELDQNWKGLYATLNPHRNSPHLDYLNGTGKMRTIVSVYVLDDFGDLQWMHGYNNDKYLNFIGKRHYEIDGKITAWQEH